MNGNVQLDNVVRMMFLTELQDPNWVNYFHNFILEVFATQVENDDFYTSFAKSDFMHTLMTLAANFNPQLGDPVVQRELRVPILPNGHHYLYSDHAIWDHQNFQDVILRAESERTFFINGSIKNLIKVHLSFQNQNQVRNNILGFSWDGRFFQFQVYRPNPTRYIWTLFDLFPGNIGGNALLPIATKRNNLYMLDVPVLFVIASIFRFSIEFQGLLDWILTAT